MSKHVADENLYGVVNLSLSSRQITTLDSWNLRIQVDIYLCTEYSVVQFDLSPCKEFLNSINHK